MNGFTILRNVEDKSLLKKAEKMRNESPAESKDEGLIEDAQGISKEDQQDILRQIDQISQANRISADANMWKVTATKKGFVVPLVINFGLYLLLAAGIFGFTQLFAASADVEQAQSIRLNTVEGQLLQEIRKEAEGRLLEKDREIREIQARLASIAQEKEQISANIDDRIRQREAQLRADLENELEQERQRLRAQGISEEVIQQRLAEFEREKTAAFNQQMATFRAQMEQERTQLEANLDAARSEFSNSLAEATRERQRIQDESRQREVELRSQIDQQNRELEAARAQAAANLQTAQSELQRLNEAAARGRAAEDRLLGLYTTIRGAIREGRIDDAASNLNTLQTYLNDPAVSTLQSLSNRREIDLFAVDLIQRTIAAERAKNSTETTQLSEALTTLSGIRAAAARGRSAANAGNQAEAAAAYREVLQLVPEIVEAQTYTERVLTAARQVTIGNALSRIDSAFASSNWPELDSAFGDLLKIVPLTDPQVVTAISRLKGAGSGSGNAERVQQDSAAIVPGLQTANAALAAGQYSGAIQQYTDLLTTYPFAEQRPQVLASIRQAGLGLSDQLSQQQAQAATQAAAARTNQEESARVIQQLDSQVATLNTRIAELEAALTQARANQGSPQTGSGSNGDSSAQVVALQSQLAQSQADFRKLQGEAENYASVAAKFERLLTSYQNYAANDNALGRSRTQASLIAAQNLMRAFFASPEALEAMPGVVDRITSIIDGYVAAASTIGTETMINAADIVDGILRAPNKSSFLEVQRTRYASNADMLAFISELDRIF